MEILIGKGTECHYRVDSDIISRTHCKLIFQNNQLFIMDLGSTNGTYVERKRTPVRAIVPIQPDMEILLSGQIPLDWNLLRKLIPGIGVYRTKMVPEAEIERALQNRTPAAAPVLPQSPSQTFAPPPSPVPPQPIPPIVVNQSQSGPGAGDFAYAVHSGKSYTGKAFLALVLYYLGFYIGGLIANILFLSEAGQSKKVLGRSPAGYGCLVFLLVWHVVIPLIFILALITGGIHFTGSLRGILRDLF